MWRNNKVLVIDDDVERRRDLKILLEFLGEVTLTSSSSDWQEVVRLENHGENYAAVFVGDFTALSENLAQLLKSLRTWNDEVAVVLIGNHPPVDETMDGAYRHMVIATLAIPPTYNKLIDTLHRAQLYR